MTDFIHCNTCYRVPSAAAPKFHLTSCYHIFCDACRVKVTSQIFVCPTCKKNANITEINTNIRKDIQKLFLPFKNVFQTKIAVLRKHVEFQEMLFRSMNGHYRRQKSKYEEMLKESHKKINERDTDIAELKKYVAELEQKVAQAEAELNSGKSTLTNLAPMNSAESTSPFFQTELDRIFTSGQQAEPISGKCFQESFRLSDAFVDFPQHEDQHMTSFNPQESVTTSDINSSISSVGQVSLPCSSPASSRNGSSLLSEMTTPKMLGNYRKSFSPGTRHGLFYSRQPRPSGLDISNPYMEVLSGSSNVNRVIPRTSGLPRIPSRETAPAYSNQSGAITRGRLIPKVNTPSSGSGM